MRKLLLALAALLAYSPAWADGPIIKWDRFEGVHFQTDDFVNYNVCIGGVICPARPRTGGQGNAILNLGTGLLTFRVMGISNPAPYTNGVLGAPAAVGQFIGTVVCNSTERFGSMEYVDTPPIGFIDGGGSFTGFLAVPEGCIARPDETVFLVRIFNPGAGTDGLYVAFGAGRTIR